MCYVCYSQGHDPDFVLTPYYKSIAIVNLCVYCFGVTNSILLSLTSSDLQALPLHAKLASCNNIIPVLSFNRTDSNFVSPEDDADHGGLIDDGKR